MRTLTTYKRPSLAVMLASAPTIQHLAAYREEMGRLFKAGMLAPAEKTRLAWIETLWVRVAELIAAAYTPEHAVLIYNTTLTWQKPAGVEEMIEAIFERRVAALPSAAERFALMGVEVVR